MRAISGILALALLGCASSAPVGMDPAALRGCWIERRGENTVTQRWFPRADGWRSEEHTSELQSQ